MMKLLYRFIFILMFFVLGARQSESRALKPYCSQEMIGFQLQKVGVQVFADLKVYENASIRVKAKHLCAPKHYLAYRLSEVEVSIYQGGKLQHQYLAPQATLSRRRDQLLLSEIPSLKTITWKVPRRFAKR